MKIPSLFQSLVVGASLAAATLASAALKVGFAQTGAESAWRTANSESICMAVTPRQSLNNWNPSRVRAGRTSSESCLRERELGSRAALT